MSTVVKAKFEVVSIEHLVGAKNVKMQAVIGGSEENKEWSKFTPSGNLSIYVTTEAFADAVPGDQYHLTFSKE